MTIPELPNDLVEEILCYVPAKLLKRLTSTCTGWNSLFNDDWRLVRKHFNKAAKQFMFLILTKNYKIAPVSINLDTTVPCIQVKSESEHCFIDPRYKYPVQFEIYRVIHCDGVLLCTPHVDKSITWFWNPLTGEKRWINTGKSNQVYRLFGPGYVYKKNKKSYKVLSCHGDINHYEMYDFNSDTWRSLGDISPGWSLLNNNLSVSLKGNTYMFALDETKKPSKSILSLLKIDYSAEKSVAVPLPFDDCSGFEVTCLSVVKGEEKLSVLLQRYYISKTEIWVTNKIDETVAKVVVSWSKVLALD